MMRLAEPTTPDTPAPSNPPFEPLSWAGILCPGRRQRLQRHPLLDLAAFDLEDHEDFYDQVERWERRDDVADQPATVC